MTPVRSEKPGSGNRKRLGRFRRWRKPRGRTAATEGLVPAADLIAELQADLRREREQIFEPLLRRMRGIGRHLADREDISPKLI